MYEISLASGREVEYQLASKSGNNLRGNKYVIHEEYILQNTLNVHEC